MKNLLLFLVALLTSALSKRYQMVSMFRHGARYHLNDVYDANSTLGLWGQLTAVGMRNHQNLGKMLRREYVEHLEILSKNYDENQIKIYTTNVNRTFESGLSQLYGLYPLGTGINMPKVDKMYHIPPYSMNNDSSEQTFSLPFGHQTIPVTFNQSVLPLSCPRTSAEMQKNQNYRIQTYRQMNLTYYPFMKKMGNMFNFTTFNFSMMTKLYDTLLVDKYLGRPMPPSFTDGDYQNLRHLTYWYSYFTLTFNLSKAWNTLVMKRVLEDFDDRIKNLQTKPLKWTFISAHDTNLFALTGDLNISSADCIEQLYRKGKTDAINCYPGPQFAASVIFELNSDNDRDFYVTIRYNGEYVNLCSRKSPLCSYQQWKAIVQRNMMIDQSRAYEICFGPGDQNAEPIKDISDLL